MNIKLSKQILELLKTENTQEILAQLDDELVNTVNYYKESIDYYLDEKKWLSFDGKTSFFSTSNHIHLLGYLCLTFDTSILNEYEHLKILPREFHMDLCAGSDEQRLAYLRNKERYHFSLFLNYWLIGEKNIQEQLGMASEAFMSNIEGVRIDQWDKDSFPKLYHNELLRLLWFSEFEKIVNFCDEVMNFNGELTVEDDEDLLIIQLTYLIANACLDSSEKLMDEIERMLLIFKIQWLRSLADSSYFFNSNFSGLVFIFLTYEKVVLKKKSNPVDFFEANFNRSEKKSSKR